MAVDCVVTLWCDSVEQITEERRMIENVDIVVRARESKKRVPDPEIVGGNSLKNYGWILPKKKKTCVSNVAKTHFCEKSEKRVPFLFLYTAQPMLLGSSSTPNACSPVNLTCPENPAVPQ